MTAHESQLQQMLVTLRTRLLVMSAMVGLALDDACKALRESDVGRASAVIDGDKAINDLENEIDAKALSLLARTQPVACDLRLVVSSLRMVIDLERIADEAASMAERTLLMEGLDINSAVLEELEELMNVSSTIYQDAIAAFREADPEKALEVLHHEDRAALLDMRIMHKLTHQLSSGIDPQLVMFVSLISRSLNRVWRRAMNLAEHTYFIYTGVSLKHKRA